MEKEHILHLVKLYGDTQADIRHCIMSQAMSSDEKHLKRIGTLQKKYVRESIKLLNKIEKLIGIIK